MNASKFIQSMATVAVALAFSAGAARAEDDLYKAFGSKEGITRIIDDFIGLVVADPRINFQFGDMDAEQVAHLKGHLVDMLCAATGGPCKYTGRGMKTTHADMDINHAQFNALAEDMYSAWDKNSVPYHVQNKLMAILAPMQKDIVTK